jgi:DNA repair exonuclease SbcCD nuclease subunit
VIPGNHDYKATGYALDFLQWTGHENLVYLTPDSKQLVYEVCEGVHAFFLPYVDVEKTETDYYHFVDSKSSQIIKDKTILIGHLYDEHVQVGSESQLFSKYVSNVNYQLFAKHFNLVISGHIHTKQEYQVGSVRVVYPGTMQCFTKHDLNLDKQLLMLDSSMQLHWQNTSHMKFREFQISTVKEDPFKELDPTKEYLIYLTVLNYQGMSHEFDEWLEEQYNKYPFIKYINPSYDVTGVDLSSSAGEVHTSGSGDLMLRETIDSEVEASLDQLPSGSNKDRIMREFDNHIL